MVILLSVPFFNEVSLGITKFVYFKTGDTLYCYFVQYALYTAAVAVILGVAYISGYSSLKFTTYFEYTALSINILRQLGKIGYLALNHEHISKSYYVWIALYIVLMICFAVAEKKKKKEIA